MAFDMTINTHKAELVWGSVMEIATGRILAWGHAPGFDPNNIILKIIAMSACNMRMNRVLR
jgi:cell division protein FtsI/penicillin-binding protein 2